MLKGIWPGQEGKLHAQCPPFPDHLGLSNKGPGWNPKHVVLKDSCIFNVAL